MQSYRSNAENPWNLYISDEDIERTECKCDEAKSTGYVLENFLSSALPVSFTRSHNVVRCDLCKILVLRNRYKEHYEDRHLCDRSSGSIMIPFDDETSPDDKVETIKKIKRNRKKRTNFKEKIKYPIEFLEKKKCKKVKVRPINKRHHSKSFIDGAVYFGKTKKLKLEQHCDIGNEKKGYFVTDEGFMSSSPKLLDDHFYGDNLNNKNNLSLDVFSLNDGIYCSNGSVNRTSSDSSTPPPLSLGTLQTLSSPSSLNILNDPSSVVTEHYFLPSNDRTLERSGVSCKYQIDSLPWENFPSMPNKEDQYNVDVGYKPSNDCIVIPLEEGKDEEKGDGEVERAVQSITNLCEGFQTELAIQKQIFIRTDKVDQEAQQRSDMFNSDEASMIDCFLDEVLGGSSTKEQLMDFSSCSTNVVPNTSVSNNLMEEYNNLSEYQMDSNFLNNFSSDYDEKFETLINNTINEFVTQSPQNICSTNLSTDKRKSYDCFDPLKHCGVVAVNGIFCHRSLLCKLHTMPQKRQVVRPESLTSLIKGIRDFNKSKRLHKKQTQFSDAFKSCNSSKTSSDSFNYNCSSTRSTEEAGSFLENRLSTPDLDVSVLNNIVTDSVGISQAPAINSNMLDPKPLVKSMFQHEVVVNGHRSLMAAKTLLWKNRPRVKSLPQQINRYQQFQPCNINLTCGQDTDNVIHLQTNTHNNLSVKNSNEMVLCQPYGSHYPLSCSSNDIQYQTNTKMDTSNNEISSIQIMNFGNQSYGQKNNNNLSMKCALSQDLQQPSSNLCVSNPDLTLSTNSFNFSSSSTMTNLNNQSSGFFNVNPQFISASDLMSSSSGAPSSSASSMFNTGIIFNDSGSNLASATGLSLANISSNSGNINDVGSGANKFISIIDEGQSASNGSILYPIRNNNQIMMVMNKNNRFFNDSSDIFNDNFVSVNQNSQNLTSMPLNSFLALKQNTGQSVQQDGYGSLSTPQIVSISPMELQRFSDSFNQSLGGQLMTTDCDKANGIIYQLNQPHNGSNSFVPTTKIEANNGAKPLTVQSSTVNGLTQKFIILPDGTISAFTQQPSNMIKPTYNQSPVINRTSLQHPIFGQLSNYGQNQTYLINNDKIIIAPTATGASTPTSGTQQILMPQLINTQSDANNLSSSALTFIHPQHPHSNKLSKINNKQPQNHLPTQIPVDSSQQKVAFQIQTQNSYPNQIPNTFFITAASPATGGTGIPLKQPIFVQSSDQLAQDISLMDSNSYFDNICNNQNKSIAIMDNLTCNSDLRTISSSSQEFDLLNHVMNPQSILIQQQNQHQHNVNRYPSKTIIQNNICRPSSVDINNGSNEGAHSSLANGQQHIVVNNPNNNPNEQFAQSQMKFSHRQMPTTSYINAAAMSHCTSMNGTNQNSSVSATIGAGGGIVGGTVYKSIPPPLVISQQLLNHSVTSQLRQQKSLSDHSYQQVQQSQQKSSQINQLVMDDSQFPNEYMIVQSMIA